MESNYHLIVVYLSIIFFSNGAKIDILISMKTRNLLTPGQCLKKKKKDALKTVLQAEDTLRKT